jgi:hypothetical protein
LAAVLHASQVIQHLVFANMAEFGYRTTLNEMAGHILSQTTTRLPSTPNIPSPA